MAVRILKKMTRTKAFLYLIERYIKKKNEGEEMKESIDSLADIFKWSRPSVSKFISYLHQHDIVKIKLSKNKKSNFIFGKVHHKTIRKN